MMIDNYSYDSDYTDRPHRAPPDAPTRPGPLAVATPTTRKLADASISVNTSGPTSARWRAWTPGGDRPG